MYIIVKRAFTPLIPTTKVHYTCNYKLKIHCWWLVFLLSKTQKSHFNVDVPDKPETNPAQRRMSGFANERVLMLMRLSAYPKCATSASAHHTATSKYASLFVTDRDWNPIQHSRCRLFMWWHTCSVLNRPLQHFTMSTGLFVLDLLSTFSLPKHWQKRHDMVATLFLSGFSA